MKEDNISQLGAVTMTRHSVNNNTSMGLVISLCSSSNHLISLIPPQTASHFRHLLSCGTITMKMTFNLNEFWYEIRQYKGEFVNKIHDNITKDNVTVTSSNISQNDETIRILKILKS